MTEDNECLICLEQLQDDKLLRCILCNRSFHTKCINSWIGVSNTCPNCRNIIILPRISKESNNSINRTENIRNTAIRTRNRNNSNNTLLAMLIVCLIFSLCFILGFLFCFLSYIEKS